MMFSAQAKPRAPLRREGEREEEREECEGFGCCDCFLPKGGGKGRAFRIK